jgi:hypothetical protein
MKTITSILLLFVALVASAARAHAADQVSVRAVLATATKEKAAADPRLAPYEATLQRNLPDSSFRFVTEGSTTATPRRPSSIALGKYRIQVEGGEKTPEGIRLSVQWMSGKDVVMNSSFMMPPGKAVVLLRRPSDDAEVPLVIVIAK